MIRDILLFVLGMTGGATLGVVFMALLSMSKHSDVESEKTECYKQGYKKGYEDGYELHKSHFK